MDALKNVMLNEEVDIKVINYLKAFAKSIGFTDTLFVSSAGDNSDGSSWEKAYISLIAALDWVATNQSTGESHLIMMGDGTFDMDTTGDPEYTSINVALIGMGKNKTFITNDHATATSILKFDSCGLTIANLTFFTGDNNITGLHLDCTAGSYLSDGTIIENVDFKAQTPTGSHSLLYIEGSTEKLNMNNCDFYGNITHTTAIYTDDATHNYYSNLHFYSCLIGIHLSDADDDSNYFKDIYFSRTDTCIQIDSAASNDNYFENIHFSYTYTTNISDASQSNYYHNLMKDGVAWEEQEGYYPDDLTGVPVVAGVGFNAFSAADVVIKTAVAATEPYYVKGFAYEADTTERWAVRFTVGSGTGRATISIVGGVAGSLKEYYFKKPFIVRQGDTLECAVKSITGGNTMDIWLIIEVI